MQVAASAGSSIAAWVPRATSTVRRVTRPCSAPCDRRQQQRERAAAGAVGHDHADAAPVERDPVELLAHERRGSASSSSTTPGPPIRTASGRHRAAALYGVWRSRSHPDRLLPAEPGVRAIARELYDAVRELPVISPHGHVDPRLLLDDEPFRDPATLLVTPDHYVTRLLHASGVALDALGVAQGPLSEERARASGGGCARTGTSFAARRCATGSSTSWSRSSASRARPSAETADAIYDELDRAARRARLPAAGAVSSGSGIAVLATTDDPCDDLAAHAALAADPTWSGRVIPTFRPDRYLEPARPGWPELMARLGAGLRRRHRRLRRVRGARWRRAAGTSSPTARRRPTTATRTCAPTPLEPAEADRIYRAALAGDGDAGGGRGVAPAHAARDGADVLRGRPGDDAAPRRAPRPPRADRGALRARHRRATSRSGSSSPTRCARCSSATARIPASTSCVFTVDETVLSRELAPLAGFYPSVYVGAPWWFLDAPEAIRRYRARGHRDRGLLAHVGLHRRHPRVLLDPGAPRHVAPRSTPAGSPQLVAEHRLDEDEAARDRWSTWSTRPPDGGVQAVTALLAAPDGRRAAGAARAPRPRQLLPRAPGVVHRPRRAATGGSPRSPAAAPSSPTRSSAQDGLYTLVTRAGDGDRFDVIVSLARAHPAGDHDAWLAYLASPDVRAVTITVTEAGYLRGADGGLDRDRAEVRPTSTRCGAIRPRRVRTAPARLRGRARRAPARRRGPAHARPVRQPARQRRRASRGSSPTSRTWSSRACATGSRRR